VSVRAEPSPWRSRDFRLFAAGNLTNNIGEAMYGFALPLLALSYTGSLATMALLVAITPIIITVAGPFLGHVADRYGSRVLVLPGLVLQLVTAVALNLVLLTGRAPVWGLYVAEILVQVGAVSYRAGWLAGIPAMFPESPGRARGSLTMLFQTSLILGPALSALLAGSIGFTGLLWLNSATFVFPLVVWFAGINPVAGQDRYRVVSASLLESLREGMRIFSRGGKMGALIAVLAPVSFAFSTATTTLFVFLASSRLDASVGAIGVALAVANIGGLVAAFVTAEIPRWRIRTLTVLTLFVAALCLVLIAVTGNLFVATAALTVFYMCDNVVSVAAEMEMFSSVPPELIGRATGMWRLAAGLPSFLAPVTIAALTGAVSPEAMFVLLALVCAAPLMWLLTHRSALTVASTEPVAAKPAEPTA
jgi:hypothetical protein